jgi:catechol 2,3-dioxygenase-like lactoylglutathione lyase family enzyme
MITGAHVVIFTKDAEAVRALFRDTLGFPAVDAGGGWLIFALPPAELAAHPADEADRHELYLMCDDVHATVTELESKGIEFSRPISHEAFGLLTTIRLPSGGELGLYEPRHPVRLRPGEGAAPALRLGVMAAPTAALLSFALSLPEAWEDHPWETRSRRYGRRSSSSWAPTALR